MYTDWLSELEDWPPDSDTIVLSAAGLGPPSHPAEADLFARHEDVPGHRQRALEQARVVLVGAGGLGSWTGLALVRSGLRHLTVVEHDFFDRTNAPRQLMFRGDLQRPKAFRVAENLLPHMIAGGEITAVRLPVQDALEKDAIGADLFVCLVDNNGARYAVSRHARRQGVPVVFAMLSTDSMRMQAFLQGPSTADACLWCALPNLDPESAAPCASATIASCLVVAGHVTLFAFRALMGWPKGSSTFNWREGDMLGNAPDRVGLVNRRPGCPTCSGAGSTMPSDLR